MILLCVNIIPISAADDGSIFIYDQYEDLMLRIDFEDYGIDQSDENWYGIVAMFNNGDISSDHFAIAIDYVEGIGDIVVFWTHWYDELETEEMFKFRLKTADNQYVLSRDSVENGIYYAEPIYCENNAHEYQDIYCDKDIYCSYEMCLECGKESFREHDYILQDKILSTCISKGYETYQCDLLGCGHTIIRELPQIAHSFNNGEVIIEPTCSVGGMREYTCEICDYSYQTPIYALGHDYNIFGNCRRADCSNNFFGIAPDFSWLTDWFSKDQDTIDDVGTKIEETIKDVFDGDGLFGGNTTTPTDDPIEEIKDLLDKSGQFIEKLISLIMGAVVGYIVVKCIPIVVAFFKGLFGIKDKRK